MYGPENVGYAKVENPRFPVMLDVPEFSRSTYLKRIEALTVRMKERNLAHIVIYGDREHNANFSYFAGFDLSFEEGMLVIDRNRNSCVLLGNECVGLPGYKDVIGDVFLFQSFSLPGQPRQDSRRLKDILKIIGVRNGSKIGLVDWKYFSEGEVENPQRSFFFPHWLVEDIAEVAGGLDRLTNATDLLMHPEYGIRLANGVEEMSVYEYASSIVSAGIARALARVKPGMTEIELGSYLNNYGVPLSCHKFVGAGAKTKYVLCRPTDSKVKPGDPFAIAFGVAGALSCRAGYIAEGESGLKTKFGSGYLNEVVKPYFATVASWYEAIRIGMPGGEIYDMVSEMFPKKKFGWVLNPGHFIAEDEWTGSPFFKGSAIALKDGTALQMDIIPNPVIPYYTSNVEDGIVIMGKQLQGRMKRKYPKVWQRLLKKKAFMKEVLGIHLQPEVFPVSSIPGILRPFILSRNKAMVIKK